MKLFLNLLDFDGVTCFSKNVIVKYGISSTFYIYMMTISLTSRQRTSLLNQCYKNILPYLTPISNQCNLQIVENINSGKVIPLIIYVYVLIFEWICHETN